MIVLAELTGSDASSLGVALAIGLLLGMQRERAHAQTGHVAPAGARTFPLVSLLGAMSVLATGGTPSWLSAVAFVGVAGLTIAAYLRISADGSKAVGLTTEALLLLTFVLGVAAGAGLREAAAVVGTAALVLVGMKEGLHGFVGRLTNEDEKAFLKFVAVALLVLPLLPDRDLGPWDAVNPRDIGRLAVLVAGVSFVAYVAVKTIGADRGILVTAVLGGIASSTATTAALARRSRESPEHAPRLAAGAIAASFVLYGRVLAIVAFVSPPFALRLVPFLAPMAVVTALACLQGLRTAPDRARASVPLKNPFELLPALLFAAAYGVVVVGARALHEWLGDPGLFVAGGLAGLTDMDAISLSMARMSGADEPAATLEKVVVVAASANAIVKASIAMSLGSREYGRRVAVGLMASAAAGVATILVL